MLEGLSSFEDARLNYLEQHAERIGIDSEKLDSARSSAARASPLTDTLDLAAVRVMGLRVMGVFVRLCVCLCPCVCVFVCYA